MRFLLVGSFLGAVAAVSGCTVGSSGRDAGGNADMGAVPDLGAPDTGLTTCTTDPQCNDGFACTIDMCAVGGMCQHTPIDGMCPSGQRCVVGTGCTAGMSGMPCTTAADCDDHVFCNGVEQCLLHECAVAMAPHNCDDGNPCTIDTCDSTTDSCQYMTTCDSGVHPDTGPVCTPFDPATDYTGTFLVVPAQNTGCGGVMYSLSSISISSGAGMLAVAGLTVNGTTVVMHGPIPTGNMFSVTATVGCGTYTLTGTFDTCREQFSGSFSAAVGGCGGVCTNMGGPITGLRG